MSDILENLRQLSQQVSSKAHHLACIHANALDPRLAPIDIYPLLSTSSHMSVLPSDDSSSNNEMMDIPQLDFMSIQSTSKHIDSSLTAVMHTLHTQLGQELNTQSIGTTTANAPQQVTEPTVPPTPARITNSIPTPVRKRLDELDLILGPSDELLPPSSMMIPLTSHFPLSANSRMTARKERSPDIIVIQSTREETSRSQAPSAPPLYSDVFLQPMMPVVSPVPSLNSMDTNDLKGYLSKMKKLRGMYSSS
jgi:hypothetical protein